MHFNMNIAMVTRLVSNSSLSRRTKCDCKRVWLWVRFPLEKIKYLFKFIFRFAFALVSWQSAAFSAATQRAMLSGFGGKWDTECLNSKFPLPNLLCAGYSVKLRMKKKIVCIKYF